VAYDLLEDKKPNSHAKARRILPIVLIAALLFAGGYYLYRWVAADDEIVVSGSIEAVEVALASQYGGRVEHVFADEGDAVNQGFVVADVDTGSSNPGAPSRDRVRASMDGTVLYRSVEPGEVVSPGQPLVTIADLDDLSLTVFVPEDQYGAIQLGGVYPVTVDSFPDEVFEGKVSHIADKAEFTPRNVQTVEGRKTTVFAIRLDLPIGDLRLKPGMPADAHFPIQQ
jgi:HlyD family secretion protein